MLQTSDKHKTQFKTVTVHLRGSALMHFSYQDMKLACLTNMRLATGTVIMLLDEELHVSIMSKGKN